MKTLIKKIYRWFMSENRYKHFYAGVAIGLFADSNYCAGYAGVIAASACEYKDKTWGGRWDWTDFAMTLSGVLVGRVITLAIGKIF